MDPDQDEGTQSELDMAAAQPLTTSPVAKMPSPRPLFNRPAGPMTGPNSPAMPAPAAAPQQTERANPLVGDSNSIPGGSSEAIAPVGTAAPKFTNPTSAGIYRSYVKNLFAPKTGKVAPRTGLRRAPAPAVY